jgi:hypothetical protein
MATATDTGTGTGTGTDRGVRARPVKPARAPTPAATAETDPVLRAEPGTTLADGRYRLQRRLGAGGMATVWLARDERLQRAVAIKLIADTLAGDESWLQRFTREARAAAALSHRGVVPVFDYGVQDGRPYLVMEYIAGGNLAQRLDGTPVRPAELTRPAQPRRPAPRSHRPSSWPGSCSRRSPGFTPPGSCTATSSPPTCSSTRPATCG